MTLRSKSRPKIGGAAHKVAVDCEAPAAHVLGQDGSTVFEPGGKELNLLQGGRGPPVRKIDPREVLATKGSYRRLHHILGRLWFGHLPDGGSGTYRMVLTYQGRQLEATFAVR